MILVLLNRRAGGGRAAALERPLREALYGRPDGLALATPRGPDEAQDLVAAWPAGTRVVVVGGDGSVHRLLPALRAHASELAVVPAGSGDDTARALGVAGLPWRAALQHALTAPARRWDLAEVQTPAERRPFVSSLCVGFDAAIAGRAQRLPAWLRGRHRYTLATLWELLALRRHGVEVTLDGRPYHRGPVLFASTLNTPTYGGGMPALPATRPDDGRLGLLLAGRIGRLQALSLLPRLLAGTHLGQPGVRSAEFAQLHLRARRPLPLAADGEPMAPAAELGVRVLPAALAVVARG